eukprot:2594973-Alexandrium_andersonii.AAC.1
MLVGRTLPTHADCEFTRILHVDQDALELNPRRPAGPCFVEHSLGARSTAVRCANTRPIRSAQSA